MREIYFRVDGVPAPQGSKTAYVRGGRAVLVEANKNLPAWRLAVKTAAQIAMHESNDLFPITEPVELNVLFFLPRPANPTHKKYPGSKPDLDHFVRAVGDSLTQSGLLKDDSLIVRIVTEKNWCSSETNSYPEPGCSIYIVQK